ncbi:MAG: NAD(P)-dependent oxidoreductase [Sterolibacteriaceae bacterium MAG5]|nr:NAD(P)-dependent oxidoreductase [Candidatus Nitricoxidireducens bremensis]
MLKHHHATERLPNRVVILGAGGFVGAALMANLQGRGVNVLGLTRGELDLLSPDAARRLSGELRDSDSLVVISAEAPVKNNSMLINNLRMMVAVCDAIAARSVSHVLYVSSDAVYADSDGLLSEESCAEPSSLHGIMHLARELMLAEVCGASLCTLRPTLIYGAADPHNGYGPNRFRRLANQGHAISLFGAGEERRDHIYVDDVAEIIARCVLQKSTGTLNVATGVVASFREIAGKVIALSRQQVPMIEVPRVGLMPHRGYRAFDSSATMRAFPDFVYTPLDDGLALSQQREFPNG